MLTINEKIRDIGDSFERSSDAYVAEQAATEMAKWMIENTIEWMKQHAGDYWYDDISIDCPEELIEDYRNSMKIE